MKQVYLLGYPVAHSLSPAFQNAAFRARGLDWEYQLLETPPDYLIETVARLRQVECAGANVTIPHKQAVFELVDETTELARQIGAVNTIVKREGRLVGDNTDAYGVLQSLREAGVEPRSRHAAIFGAGGAARATAFALASSGIASLTILNRTRERAEGLADSLRRCFPSLTLTTNDIWALHSADLVVNATSLGMTPRIDDSPLPDGFEFSRAAVAFDLVYRPTETRFMREAARGGAQTIGGLSMLIYQGAAAFRLWTGCDAPVEIMRQTAQQALES